MEEIVKETERVAKKQKLSSAKAAETLQALLSEVQAARAQISSSQEPNSRAEAFRSLQQRISGHAGDVAATQAAGRELNAVVARMGKSLDKPCGQDVERAWWNKPMDQTALDTVIVQHLLRQGHFSVAEKYAQSSGVSVDNELKESFVNMHNLIQQLRARNVEPALQWAVDRREALSGASSSQAVGPADLEFRLHVLKFVSLLQQEGRGVAVAYARATFPALSRTPAWMAEIQRLMGCLMYAGRLTSSPYADLLSKEHWDAVEGEFMRKYCSLMGKASESLLSVCLHAGMLALPFLLKMVTVISVKSQAWDEVEQLPVEIELGRDFVFRSVFACPVAREQSTPENPPMILPCGLVLCRSTIQKLAKGNARSFKCPYCPIETNIGQCRQIYF